MIRNKSLALNKPQISELGAFGETVAIINITVYYSSQGSDYICYLRGDYHQLNFLFEWSGIKYKECDKLFYFKVALIPLRTNLP